MPFKLAGRIKNLESSNEPTILNSKFSIPNSNKGFTLIELMVVISIIAILATIGLTTYTSTQRNGRDAKRISDALEIQKALEQYYLDNKIYPDEGAGHSLPNSLVNYFSASQLPTDPGGVNGYGYLKGGAACTDQNTYVSCVTLENPSGGNRSTYATSGCDPVTGGDPAITTHYFYCVGHLSN